MTGVFKTWAPVYRAMGLEPRPIAAGQKGCKISEWQRPDAEIGEIELQAWLKLNGDQGIGLKLGTRLPDGTRLGAFDVDRDDLVEVARTLLGRVCERRGAKGTAIFFRYVGDMSRKALKRPAAGGKREQVADLLVGSSLCVVPPTTHPSKNAPYEWLTRPIHEIDLSSLPLIGRQEDLAEPGTNGRSLELIRAVFESEHLGHLGSGAQTHDAGLALVNELLPYTQDANLICALVRAALPPTYSGNTLEEVHEFVASGLRKGMHLRGGFSEIKYEPGPVGPIAFGYLANGDYVLFDQRKRVLIPVSSNSLFSVGTLAGFAPLSFWRERFPQAKGGVAGVNTTLAADTVMQSCILKGGFDPSLVRGRGVYFDPRAGLVVNWGGPIPEEAEFVYVCHRPLKVGSEDPIDPQTVLSFFRRFNWSDASAADLLFGWLVASVICGVLGFRPHVFINGAKQTGKTTLTKTIQDLLRPVGIALDGGSTEAGIRQSVGADSRPVVIDEFEGEQSAGRLRQIIKTMRSASSSDAPVARGTPEGKALEFTLRSAFLLAAINPVSVTAADRSRIVVLSLLRHGDDPEVARAIEKDRAAFRTAGPSWCSLVLSRTERVLANIATLREAFPAIDLRHKEIMATLLGAGQAVLQDDPLTAQEATDLIARHKRFIDELGEAHEADDSQDCWQALLEYRVRASAEETMLCTLMARVKAARLGRGHANAGHNAEAEIAKFGIRWIGDGVVVANSHRGLSDVFHGTLWEAGTWGPALKRLQGAKPTKQKRFHGENARSEGTWIPADLIPEAGMAAVSEEF